MSNGLHEFVRFSIHALSTKDLHNTFHAVDQRFDHIEIRAENLGVTSLLNPHPNAPSNWWMTSTLIRLELIYDIISLQGRTKRDNLTGYAMARIRHRVAAVVFRGPSRPITNLGPLRRAFFVSSQRGRLPLVRYDPLKMLTDNPRTERLLDEAG